jgi:hypothetical protein
MLRGEQEFPPQCIPGSRKRNFFALAVLCFAALSASSNVHAAPPGTIISNQAALDYQNAANQPVSVQSNEVQLVTAVIRSASTVQLTRLNASGSGAYQEPVGPAACLQGGAFIALGNPVSNGQTIDAALLQDVGPSSNYNLGETFFLRLDDSDQNIDAAQTDYADVTVQNTGSGDSENVRLSETGINSGIFAGFIPSENAAASPGDCVLQGQPGNRVEARYTDPNDAADASNSNAGLDPTGRVFDSRTGAAVSGAIVELIDNATGLPAVVYGNDGTSTYPSSVSSGQPVSDSGGANYAFGPGQYRFPVVAEGDYRMIITPPTGYFAPSGDTSGD